MRLKIAALLGLCLALAACRSMGGPKLEDLTKDVDAYHRDLIFERYDVAAKRLDPLHRASYIENIRQQRLRFAEIDVMSVEPCQPQAKDCMLVSVHVQWYSHHSPVLQSNMLTEKWQYDEEQKTWLLIEQTQK
ncbi:MAG: hypothetical protein FWC40_08405 [Proteobacteria bacterium]|nr:hypothetical protein [Pseudomonadota bacterium]